MSKPSEPNSNPDMGSPGTTPRSALALEVVNPSTDPRWEMELARHSQATVFHTAAWARVLQATYGFRPHYVMLKSDDAPSALLPLMEIRQPWGSAKAVSLPFTDSCPLLLPAGQDRPDLAALQSETAKPGEPIASSLLRQVHALARSRRWRSVELRLGLLERADEPSSVRFYNHTVPLAPTDEAQLATAKSAIRRCVKQSQASPVQITLGTSLELLTDYFGLHCLTRQRQGAPPQPWPFFRSLHQELLTRGMGYVVLAKLESRPIAGAVFLHHGVHAMYKFGASDLSFQNLRPNHGVMWTGIRHAAKLGCTAMDLGRTSMANDGLRQFKSGWGAVEVTQVYHCLELASNRWLATPDRTTGWQTQVFQRLPLWASRSLGRLLYRFAA
jgi:CelD/BcsL family acetyltransferase involved in cellulose biosynthesis